MKIDVNLRGLREILRKFNEDGRCVKSTHWMIAKGGYDLYWELYYDNIPIIDCVANSLENLCLEKGQFLDICKVIKSEYDNDKWNPIRIESEPA